MAKEKKMSLMRIAVQNLKYRGFRSGAMIFLIFLLASCLFISLTLLNSMTKDIQRNIQRMGAEIIVSPKAYQEDMLNAMFEGKPCTIYFERSWLDRVVEIEGVEKASPQLYIATMQESPCCDLPSQLIAFDPETDFIVQPWLKKADIPSLGIGEVIIGNSFLSEVGDTLMFFDTPFNVVAKLEPTNLSYDTSIFLSFDSVNELAKSQSAQTYLRLSEPENMISMILVDVVDGVEIDKVKREIDYQYRKADIQVTTANLLVSNASAELSRFTTYNIILISLLFVVVTFAVWAIFTLSIHERKKEFGIFYTIGAVKSQVGKIIALEGFLISMIGGIVGVGFSGILMVLFQNLIGQMANLPYIALEAKYLVPTAILCITASVITGLASSSYAVFSITKDEPYLLTKEDQ